MTPHEQRVSRAGFAQALHKAIDRGKDKEEETQESMRDSATRDALDKRYIRPIHQSHSRGEAEGPAERVLCSVSQGPLGHSMTHSHTQQGGCVTARPHKACINHPTTSRF